MNPTHAPTPIVRGTVTVVGSYIVALLIAGLACVAAIGLSASRTGAKPTE